MNNQKQNENYFFSNEQNNQTSTQQNETNTMLNDLKKNNEQPVDDKKKKRSKIIRNILIALIVVAIIAITVFVVYRILVNQANEQIRKEMENGVIVEKQENVETDIKVKPSGTIRDKDGKEIPVGHKIENNSDINLSDDAIRAIEIENGGVQNITVNGQPIKGGVNIENGVASYYDENNVFHKVPADEIRIEVNNQALDSNIIKEMNNINYKSDGSVVFSELTTQVKFNGRDVTTSYMDSNGLLYGKTQLQNVTEKDGSFYSYTEAGYKELSRQHQDNLRAVKEYIGNKWPITKYETIQDIFESDVQEHSLPLKVNSQVSTNLKNVTPGNHIS